MFTHAPQASPRMRAHAPARETLIESKLARFRPEVQPRVRRLAALHPWIADLALSFPALLFALAAPRNAADAKAALHLVIAGAPLPAIAACAGAPMWMRAFPPEAFAAPLPALPDDAAIRRRIANHFPKRWADAPRWIESVGLAAKWGDEELALWFAREAPAKARRKRRYAKRALDFRHLVLLWAWFSTRPDTRAHAHAAVLWRPELQWKAAQDAAIAWRESLALDLYLGERGVTDTWLEPGEADGYTFTPLTSACDVADEALAMKNCVRTYASSLSGNDSRLWSVRKDGARVATLALVPGFLSPLTHIHELSLEGNKPAPVELWLAASRWLHAQDSPNANIARFAYKAATFDAAIWRALWRPYWLAKQRIPTWLPLKPCTEAFHAL